MPLSAARNTKERLGDIEEYPVKAATTCYQGGMAVLNAGYAAPGTAATGLVAIGRFEETADNSAGAAGAIKARVKRGKFLFANSAAGDAIAQADVGAACYIVDDQTVAKTDGAGSRSRAGHIVAVETAGVWVQIGLGL
ncbi:hypothetical protein [Methylobacter tundripaludum]|uniref:hypothetical protein n=1 Tax=Methylobacter tundripaludum TaxID=173365 RepID=UPI0004DFBC8B|nr:hypothetical protein [Methylobacter tundripaludum]